MTKYYIYILTLNGVVFYVGVTDNPTIRQKRHESVYGKDVKMEIKEEYFGSKKTAILLEDFWAAKYIDLGATLHNKNSQLLVRRCKFCDLEVRQQQGKRQKEFCNNTCRSNYWYGKNKKGKVTRTEVIKEHQEPIVFGKMPPEKIVIEIKEPPKTVGQYMIWKREIETQEEYNDFCSDVDANWTLSQKQKQFCKTANPSQL